MSFYSYEQGTNLQKVNWLQNKLYGKCPNMDWLKLKRNDSPPWYFHCSTHCVQVRPSGSFNLKQYLTVPGANIITNAIIANNFQNVLIETLLRYRLGDIVVGAQAELHSSTMVESQFYHYARYLPDLILTGHYTSGEHSPGFVVTGTVPGVTTQPSLTSLFVPQVLKKRNELLCRQIENIHPLVMRWTSETQLPQLFCYQHFLKALIPSTQIDQNFC